MYAQPGKYRSEFARG